MVWACFEDNGSFHKWVQSVFKINIAQLSSRARSLTLGLSFRLVSLFVNVSGKGSGETAQMLQAYLNHGC